MSKIATKKAFFVFTTNFVIFLFAFVLVAVLIASTTGFPIRHTFCSGRNCVTYMRYLATDWIIAFLLMFVGWKILLEGR